MPKIPPQLESHSLSAAWRAYPAVWILALALSFVSLLVHVCYCIVWSLEPCWDILDVPCIMYRMFNGWHVVSTWDFLHRCNPLLHVERATSDHSSHIASIMWQLLPLVSLDNWPTSVCCRKLTKEMSRMGSSPPQRISPFIVISMRHGGYLNTG